MRTVQVQDVELAYEVHGETGAPVLLLGGTGMPGFVWTLGIVPALVEAGYRAITVDGRGVGSSGAPPGPYSIADLAADTAGLITELGLGSVHLVGLSQGGFIAEHLAAARPDLLRSATLMASAGATTTYTRTWAQAWRELLAAVEHPPASLFVLDDVLGLPPELLRDNDTASAEWVELLSARTGLADPGMLGQYAACHAWLLEHDHAAAWPGIGTPCLVMSFEHDLRWPPRSGRRAAEAIPAGEFTAIAGVGHTNGLFDAAEQITDALLAFLSNAPPPRTAASR